MCAPSRDHGQSSRTITIVGKQPEQIAHKTSATKASPFVARQALLPTRSVTAPDPGRPLAVPKDGRPAHP